MPPLLKRLWFKPLLLRMTVLLVHRTDLTLVLLTVALEVRWHRIEKANARLVAHDAGSYKMWLSGRPALV